MAAILAFIGVKLVLEALHGSGIEHFGRLVLPEIGTAGSLEFIVAALTVHNHGQVAKFPIPG